MPRWSGLLGGALWLAASSGDLQGPGGENGTSQTKNSCSPHSGEVQLRDFQYALTLRFSHKRAGAEAYAAAQQQRKLEFLFCVRWRFFILKQKQTSRGDVLVVAVLSLDVVRVVHDVHQWQWLFWYLHVACSTTSLRCSAVHCKTGASADAEHVGTSPCVLMQLWGGTRSCCFCWLPIFPPPRHPRELRCHVGHDMQSLICFFPPQQ